MISAAERDLRLLEDATSETRENEAFRRGESVIPACGWAAQGQLKLLSNYLRSEGVRAAVPGWRDNFPKNLRFLIDVTKPPASEPDASDVAPIVPPQEVVEAKGDRRTGSDEQLHRVDDMRAGGRCARHPLGRQRLLHPRPA